MCGRFSIHLADLADLAVLGEALGVVRSGIEVWEPRFNVAPTQLAPVVRQTGDGRILDQGRFGLVPRWADDPTIGSRLINARIETVASRPAFRDAFRRHRCIVPATGYFEWKPEGPRRKQPMWLHPDPSGAGSPAPLLFLAGLWSRWYPLQSETSDMTAFHERRADPQATRPRHPRSGRDGSAPIDSFCILTRPAAGIALPIHDRMPVALPPDIAGAWLTAPDPHALLDPILQASEDTRQLVATPVSTAVNSPRNDGPECIAEVMPAADRQLDLF